MTDDIKPLTPISMEDWEMFEMRARMVSKNGFFNMSSIEQQLSEMADYVLLMGKEIMRLRLTYGEEVWPEAYDDKGEIDSYRKVHELDNKKRASS